MIPIPDHYNRQILTGSLDKSGEMESPDPRPTRGELRSTDRETLTARKRYLYTADSLVSLWNFEHSTMRSECAILCYHRNLLPDSEMMHILAPENDSRERKLMVGTRNS
jgi:hypothetical protein